jgi:hypothetical protein
MYEPCGMGRVERRGDAVEDPRCALGGEAAPLGDDPVQVAPLHQAHRQVEPSALLARVVDGDHVRVLDRRGHP